jgi:glycosyltransferase involved in cell wall biosynthesis
MRFHIFGLPHTKTNQDYTACAYTAKVLKFAEMMTERGHHVTHYGHPDSRVRCTEHVDVISTATYDSVYGDHDFHSKFFKYDTQDAAYQEFYARAIEEVGVRKQPLDFLLPFWGAGHRPICDAHPDLITVEPGAGYAGGYWARWKVFESYALYHAYYGLEAVGRCRQDNYDVVINNYFDHRDFEFKTAKDEYVLFLGRVYSGKGLDIAVQATERTGHRLVVAGQGTMQEAGYDQIPDHVDFVGYADRDMRRILMANAKCSIIASQYLEPFGGVQVENLFSGTPIVTSDWGAMSEINIHGVTGYRCRNMEQYVWAIRNINRIDPAVCRQYAMNNFTFQAIAPKYEEFFQQILDVYSGAGWYAEHGIDQIHLPNRYIPNTDNRIDFAHLDQEEQPQALRLAQWVKENIAPDRVLDVGCGPGTYVDEFVKLGIDTLGIDPDKRTSGSNLRTGSLLNNLEESAPCVVCLEVLEHIDPTYETQAITNLVACVDDVLIFTAARPGQGGVGHINCRPREYWLNELTAAGLAQDTQLEQQLRNYMLSGPHMGWFVQNLIVMRR